MTWSTRRCVLVLALVVAGWCWAMGQSAAHTDPSYRLLELEPAPARQQRISDTVCRHLAARGFNVRPCPRVWTTPSMHLVHDGPTHGIAAVATSAGTVLAPVVPEWGRTVQGMGMTEPTELELRVHVHELLHRLHAVRPAGVTTDGLTVLEHWSWTPWQRQVEEWAVEAVTLDLLPGAYRRLTTTTPTRGQLTPDAYADGVRSFRAISARIVGAGWRTRPARSWRAWFVKQDQQTRTAALLTLGL